MPRIDHVAGRRIAIGLFFEDPDGRRLEAITYKNGEDLQRR